jgi:hypothetical protein
MTRRLGPRARCGAALSRRAGLAVCLAAVTLLAATAAGAAAPKSRKTVSETRIVCGMTGCFEVKPGCGYEMRRSGKGGIVAVVFCDKK